MPDKASMQTGHYKDKDSPARDHVSHVMRTVTVIFLQASRLFKMTLNYLLIVTKLHLY